MAIIRPGMRAAGEPYKVQTPTNVFVERVAKILFDQKIKPGGSGRTLMAWPACPEAEHCRANAREILASLFEPTSKMKWNVAQMYVDEIPALNSDIIEDIWRLMWREALP